jgi:hypothetical protein
MTRFKITELESKKNKRGEIKVIAFRIQNKNPKGTIHYDDINEIYKDMLKDSGYNAKQFVVLAKTVVGGWTTLKNKNDNTPNLKHIDEEDYFKDAPQGTEEKYIGNYYSFDIIIDV